MKYPHIIISTSLFDESLYIVSIIFSFKQSFESTNNMYSPLETLIDSFLQLEISLFTFLSDLLFIDIYQISPDYYYLITL